MKHLFFTITFFALASCSNNESKKRTLGKGNFKGNVYWKYNKYVGNRPDAGASVTLYNMSDTSKMYFTKTDVRGDFAIDSIPEGVYFSIIQSKNTTGSPKELYDEISLYAETLKKLTGYDLKSLVMEHNKDIKRLDSLKNVSLMISNSRLAIKLYDQYSDSVNAICSSIIRQLPKEVRWKISIIAPYSSKVSYNLINISANKTESKVIDFGITYM